MYTYSVYGLVVRSEFELPELPTVEADPANADVSFRRADVDPVPESVEGKGGRRIQASPGRCRLSYESYGSFLVEDGEQVFFDPHSEDVLDMKVTRRLFENEMLGVALYQRGRLVLHASAVSIDGRAAVFLGPRGVGKSTTAAAFHAAGHRILEDDIVSVRFEDESPLVDPGVPEMRLKPDAVDELGVDGATDHPDDGGSGKLYSQFDAVSRPAQVAGCYLLRTDDSVSLDTVPDRGQLFKLVESTYTQGLLSDTRQTETHFQQCVSVVETTPFRFLSRPENLEELSSVVDTVVRDLKESHV